MPPNLPTSPTQFFIALQAYLNAQGSTQSILSNYNDPSDGALTANGSGTQPVVIPPSTAGFEINLPAMFPGLQLPLYVALQDASTPQVGFKWTTDAGGTNKQTVAPGGFLAWTADGSTALVPIYVDNPNSINNLVIAISVASN